MQSFIGHRLKMLSEERVGFSLPLCAEAIWVVLIWFIKVLEYKIQCRLHWYSQDSAGQQGVAHYILGGRSGGRQYFYEERQLQFSAKDLQDSLHSEAILQTQLRIFQLSYTHVQLVPFTSWTMVERGYQCFARSAFATLVDFKSSTRVEIAEIAINEGFS